MKHRNHAAWIGPLVVFVGGVSYFELFARFPGTRDVPWVNLPLVAVGTAISVLGLRRALGGPPGRLRRILAGGGLLFSAGLAFLFGSYVFVISYWLPAPTAVGLDLPSVPDLTLADSSGTPVSLSDYRGRNLLIVFYRGYW